MKKIALTTLLVVFSFNLYWSCDICGCSVHGNYWGGLQSSKNNSIGLAHTFFRFNTTHHDIGGLTTAKLHTLALSGNIAINEKWRLSGFVPLMKISFSENGQTSYYTNLADAPVYVGKTIYNSPDSLKWRHLWVFNVGLKLPTGNYTNMNTSEVSFYNFRTGTASWDALLSSFYSISKRTHGASVEINYSINTPSKYKYWFGNNLNTQISLFTKTRIKRSALIPLIAYRFEHAQKDLSNMVERLYTGGYAHYATLGFMLRNDNFMFDVNYALPFKHNISEGIVTPFNKTQLRIIYFLKSKNHEKN